MQTDTTFHRRFGAALGVALSPLVGVTDLLNLEYVRVMGGDPAELWDALRGCLRSDDTRWRARAAVIRTAFATVRDPYERSRVVRVFTAGLRDGTPEMDDEANELEFLTGAPLPPASEVT